MNWKQVLFLSCLVIFLLLIVLEGSDAMAVGSKNGGTGDSTTESVKERVFMQESDASNFFKKRGKRSANRFAESRRRTLAADEESREYHEEQRDEFENFVEEERSEQDERSREQVEQWREYHYDGLYPPYLYNRHIV